MGERREGRTAALRGVNLGFELEEELSQKVKGEGGTKSSAVFGGLVRERGWGEGDRVSSREGRGDEGED